MSDGDEESAETPDVTDEDLDVETLESRLEEAADTLEESETEADLDEVEAALDDAEAAIEAADLPEPDEDAEGEEEAADPREELSSRLSELRDELEEKRGPYASDVVEAVEEAASKLAETRWTEQGEESLESVVEEYAAAVGEALDGEVDVDATGDPEALAAALREVAETIEDADLDADGDAATIAALVEATETLTAGVEDAQEWDDLSVREKLDFHGFYDALGEKHKDFPPEWSALKEWEKRGNAEMVLLLLDHMGDAGHIERHCLDSLERMGSPDAVEAMLPLAGKRNKQAITILGKTGTAAEEALDTILEYTEADSDPGLQRVTLKALGEIGSAEATQNVADCLATENDAVRSQAARALGLLGDARAVAPLADVLADDEADNVRASAAWALYQIGTREALEAAAEYDEDRSYIVEVEATRAADALDAEDAEAPTA